MVEHSLRGKGEGVVKALPSDSLTRLQAGRCYNPFPAMKWQIDDITSRAATKYPIPIKHSTPIGPFNAKSL
jgi:hypothetical protein